MLLKPGKNHTDVESYRPLAPLPIMWKLFEKPILKRLKLIIEKHQLVLSHPFGFRSKHSTIDQVHRTADVIEKSFVLKKYALQFFGM
jgi:hypothetical protein